MENSTHTKVENQYTHWVYPLPVPDMAKSVAEEGYYDLTDPALFRPLLWPSPVEPDALNILIAGCGANQAAYYAYKNPHCQVTGIDISDNSLAHQNYLKEKHQLNNLTLQRATLEEAPEVLKQQFDYIVSTGVLHHLPDPDVGLAALKSMLNPQGVMAIMVYGKYMRTGVYMMQELFRLVGLKQDAAAVAVVRATLESLPPTHSTRHYAQNAGDIHYDAGLVDTFLHRSDRAYSVPEVLAFADRAGLAFRGWLDKSLYSVEALVPFNHPLRPLLEALPEAEQWAGLELLTQALGCHRFLLCHKDVDPASYTPDFNGDAWTNYQPHLRPPVTVEKSLDAGGPAIIRRAQSRFEVQSQESALMEAVNGQRSIAEIIAAYPEGPHKKDATEIARKFFSRMSRLDHLQFRLSTPVQEAKTKAHSAKKKPEHK